MNIPVTRTVLAALAIGLTTACGGPSDDEALASEALEGPGDPYADETAYGFDDFDMDGDSELDVNEFHEWVEAPAFAVYSRGADAADAPENTGALDDEVLIDGLFLAWDANEDNALDSLEWSAASDVLETFSDTTGAWIEFDMDGSRQVDLAEMRTHLDRDRLLQAMDADQDGDVTDQELDEWFFALFDIDDDGAVDRDEWRLAELYLDVPTL